MSRLGVHFFNASDTYIYINMPYIYTSQVVYVVSFLHCPLEMQCRSIFTSYDTVVLDGSTPDNRRATDSGGLAQMQVCRSLYSSAFRSSKTHESNESFCFNQYGFCDVS